jgi:Tfp pilus assembly protein PilF
VNHRSRTENNRRWRATVLVVAALVLAGCQSGPMRDMKEGFKDLFAGSKPKGEPALAVGIRQYEDGKYPEASESLHSALYQGLSSADRVKAHKTLAFINCVSSRPAACREEFRRALAIDPALELVAAEAGHPIWGPVFRAVKTGR